LWIGLQKKKSGNNTANARGGGLYPEEKAIKRQSCIRYGVYERRKKVNTNNPDKQNRKEGAKPKSIYKKKLKLTRSVSNKEIEGKTRFYKKKRNHYIKAKEKTTWHRKGTLTR